MGPSAKQVEAFRAVMLSGGVTPAAETLHVSQPAVSRLLRDLEEVIGLNLFVRRGNQLIPTREAYSLLGEVQRSFVGLGQIGAFAEALKSQDVGSLRIAAMPVLATGVLTRFLAKFLHRRPKARASITGIPSYSVIDAVSSGQADLGYADSPVEPAGLAISRIAIPAIVAIPEQHELARRKVIAPKDLAGERIVGLLPGSLFRSRLDVALEGLGCNFFVETQLAHTACLLVAEGAGISIVDPYAAIALEGRGLVIRRFSVTLDTGFLCVRSERQPASLLATSFASEFEVHIRELMAPYGA